MTMKNAFHQQLNGTPLANQDIIDKLKNKNYFNDDPVEVGDVVLFGMIMGDPIEKKGEITQLLITLAMLNERHFHVFEVDDRSKGSQLPVIKYKKK